MNWHAPPQTKRVNQAKELTHLSANIVNSLLLEASVFVTHHLGLILPGKAGTLQNRDPNNTPKGKL
jgi:hypothetical protein